MSKLDELNIQVTSAIYQAEHLEDGTAESKNAWLEVSRIEEEIAKITTPIEIEGHIARRGAVSALLEAGETNQARALLTRFISEGNIDPGSIETLKIRLRE